jgi:hypothetical protein
VRCRTDGALVFAHIRQHPKGIGPEERGRTNMDNTVGKLFGIIGPYEPVTAGAAMRTAACSLASWKVLSDKLGRKRNLRSGV